MDLVNLLIVWTEVLYASQMRFLLLFSFIFSSFNRGQQGKYDMVMGISMRVGGHVEVNTPVCVVCYFLIYGNFHSREGMPTWTLNIYQMGIHKYWDISWHTIVTYVTLKFIPYLMTDCADTMLTHFNLV